MKHALLALTLLLSGISLVQADESIPAQYVGTWRRVDVLDKKTGNKIGERAGARWFMILRADGKATFHGSDGRPNPIPIKFSIRGDEIWQKPVNSKEPERVIGKASLQGNYLKLIFTKPELMAPSGYTFVSRNTDPDAIKGKP